MIGHAFLGTTFDTLTPFTLTRQFGIMDNWPNMLEVWGSTPGWGNILIFSTVSAVLLPITL